MAVFGFHLVLTLVAATIFSKLSVRFSFCDFFIFKGLYYYLLEGSLIPKFNNNKIVGPDGQQLKRKKRNRIQKDLDEREDRLFRLPLTSAALEGIPYIDSLIWAVNYSCFALLVYAISDIFNWIFPQNRDLNTSMIWLICSLILQAHILMRIAMEKATAPELFPERNTLICAVGLFFLGSMVLNAFSDRFFDLDFVGGYTTFVDRLNEFVHQHGFKPLFSESARSPMPFMVCLSLLYSIIGASMFFPILQSTSLQMDILEAGECSMTKKLLLHISFFTPAAALLFFLRPMVEQILEGGLLNHEQIRTIRILLIILMALLRVATAKICIQTFLDQPKKRLLEYRQRELRDEEKQRKVANFASYTAITALQFYFPTAICLCVGLILKHFGNISFWSLLNSGLPTAEMSNSSEEVTKILLAREIQEPLWTLTLVTFLSIQLIVSLIGLIGQRAFL